jgi:hypothetical protein
MIEHDTNDHLVHIGTVILAVAKLADCSSLSLKVEGCRVEEDDIEAAEKVLTQREQVFFDAVLGATRREGRTIFLVLDLFSEKSHGTVKVMQGHPINVLDDIIPAPRVAGPVRTRGEKPVHNRHENSPFYIEAKLPASEKPMKDSVNPQFPPQPLKDEGGADLLCLGMDTVALA